MSPLFITIPRHFGFIGFSWYYITLIPDSKTIINIIFFSNGSWYRYKSVNFVSVWGGEGGGGRVWEG